MIAFQVENVSRACSDNMEVMSSFSIQLVADNLALFVWLEVPDVKGWFSDNGFLMVDSSATLMYHTFDLQMTSDEVMSSIEIKSLFDVYNDQ